MTNSIHERKPASLGKPPVSFRNSSLPISGDSRSRLGVVMIVKDEEKNIGSLLEDIKGIFDEVVVVDTGSTDRTLEILRSYGVNIGHFNWCDDFSAARNKSIELSAADYLLWLDADDRIDADAGKAILALKSSLPEDKRHAYILKILNAARDHPETESYQLRIFPRLDGVRFEGRLHEQIMPSLERVPGMKIQAVDITIRHTGYQDEEDMLTKGKRNLAIQLRELREGRDTARQNFFIAMSYHALKDYENCLEFIHKARKKTSIQENWFRYTFTLATECYMKLNRIDSALKEARDGVSRFPETGTMHYDLGAMYLKAEEYEHAVEALEKASQLGIQIDIFPTPPSIRATMYHYLGISYEKLGYRGKAISAYRRALDMNPNWGPSLKSLGLALIQSGDADEAVGLLEKSKQELPQFDPVVWLSLAGLYCYKERYHDAHALYREAADTIPAHRDALAGLIRTSITIDDVDSILWAVNTLMQSLGMDTDREIGSVSEIAELCAEVAKRLIEKNDKITGKKILEAALALDDCCTQAYLLSSDLESAEGGTPQALAYLEKALLNGASPEAVEARMKEMGGQNR